MGTAGSFYRNARQTIGAVLCSRDNWRYHFFLFQRIDLFDDEKYWVAYKNVHRFVIDRFVNKGVGEWFPLLTRRGEPIWTHMGHSWKTNYHTVRSLIQSIRRMDKIITNL